jgi:uncharacterized damage-inducible protein DinB
MDSLDRIFLTFSANKLNQLTSRIKDCIDKLSDEQIWGRHNENENAVGNLMLHLSGNVRQWIISGIGGKPDIRVRDREFSARDDVEKTDLWERLHGTVEDATAVIEELTPERLAETVKIQSYEVTVAEAIYHVVEHFAQHTGQIIYATKMLTNEDLGFYKHLQARAVHDEKTP